VTNELLTRIGDYYSAKLAEHGPSSQGVDWNSPHSQELRFQQLLRVCDSAGAFDLNDYGCGYGALADYLLARHPAAKYTGFDVTPAMVAKAKELHPGSAGPRFTSDDAELVPANYTVASGIFNVRLDTPRESWEALVLDTLDRLSALSRRGFAFNVLTSYSDAHLMRDDLYYADPCLLFDHCKRKYARNVALLHDYGLWEFTILVRKELG